MHPRNHGSTCPTKGVANARYTRGSIDDGPGVNINRFGGFNSPICSVMEDSYSSQEPRGTSILPHSAQPPQPTNWSANDALKSLPRQRSSPASPYFRI